MKTNVFVLFHLSTGDNFTMYAMILYLTTIYENVYIFCLHRNYETITQLYELHPKIHICKCDSNHNYCNVPIDTLKYYCSTITDYEIIKTGCHNSKWEHNDNFWKGFYSVVNIDYNLRYVYTSINRHYYKEDILFNKIKNIYGEKYIFVHDHRNYDYKHNSIRPNVIVNSETPIFHPNYNYYNDDTTNSFYNYWNNSLYLNNLLDYCSVIENAEEIHISDSSFSCLCPYLDLSKVKRKCIYTTLNVIDYHESFKNWTILPPL